MGGEPLATPQEDPMTDADPQHPYSPAVRRGNLVFVSGSLSVDRDFQPVSGRHEALAADLPR